jgi:hypothetical protein
LSYYFWPVDESTYIKGEAIKMTQQKFKGDNISSMNIMKLKFNTALQYEIEVIIQQTYFFLGFKLLSNDAKKEKEKKKTFQNQFIFVQNILYIT